MLEKVADYRQGGQAAVVRVAVTNTASEVGSGAVQNCYSRWKVSWVSSASAVTISLLFVDELDEGNQLSLKTTGKDTGWLWSSEMRCM